MIIRTEVDKWVDKRGYIEFEISADDKYEVFDPWGMGAVMVEELKNKNSCDDNVECVCFVVEYPLGDDFWAFGLSVYFKGDCRDPEWYDVKLPKTIKDNLKKQILN